MERSVARVGTIVLLVGAFVGLIFKDSLLLVSAAIGYAYFVGIIYVVKKLDDGICPALGIATITILFITIMGIVSEDATKTAIMIAFGITLAEIVLYYKEWSLGTPKRVETILVGFATAIIIWSSFF